MQLEETIRMVYNSLVCQKLDLSSVEKGHFGLPGDVVDLSFFLSFELRIPKRYHNAIR